MFISSFVIDPLWNLAVWKGTTFRWHSGGEQPPIMGIVFEKPTAAHDLFSKWIARFGNADPLEELRLSIIEGEIPGQQSGYTVHVTPEIEGADDYLKLSGTKSNFLPVPLTSRVNRMYTRPDNSGPLIQFKHEFSRHKEFLFAPVTRRGHDQFWIDIEMGIVKRKIYFRNVADLRNEDIDIAATRSPSPITL